MTLSSASVTFGPAGPALSVTRNFSVEALVMGRPVAEALELLPRIFNLCSAAQSAAARLSLGLNQSSDLSAEVIRDHVLRLCVILPRVLGEPPIAIPKLAADLLGPSGLPSDVTGIAKWQSPAAAHARRIMQDFRPGVATCKKLQQPADALADGPFENSAAGRQSQHPLMLSVERDYGRGPLWRYCGLLADLACAIEDRLPAAVEKAGVATVPAARGSYALRLQHSGGMITGITRRTPTDHLLAEGGALLQSLATLPSSMADCAERVIALHDPCIPVKVEVVAHA